MIDRLKRRFLLIATVFMFILMSVLVLIMNLVNYREVVSESDSVLSMLSRPDLPFLDGQFPPEDGEEWGDITGFIPPGMSLEVPYESRFFVVTVSGGGEVLQSDLSRIISVTADAAEDHVRTALKSSRERGFIGNFRYLKMTDGSDMRIVFLDCGRKLDQFRSFLWISVLVGLGGCVAVFLAFIFTAGKIVSPIAESYEKQKRFISDAGHEIKTPLTIINANVDLLEAEDDADGEREELTEIRRQTRRLTELTNDLVTLSKMEEAEHTLQKVEFPLSDLVTETAGQFRAPAAARGLELDISAEPNISLNGSPDAIRRLVSVLLENAVKYSPEGGRVRLSLAAHRKSAVLTVCNDAEERLSESELQHIFDRFYRTDPSRNSGTGGHGIGLSIAKAIVEAHGGSISASAKTGRDFTVTAVLPQ